MSCWEGADGPPAWGRRGSDSWVPGRKRGKPEKGGAGARTPGSSQRLEGEGQNSWVPCADFGGTGTSCKGWCPLGEHLWVLFPLPNFCRFRHGCFRACAECRRPCAPRDSAYAQPAGGKTPGFCFQPPPPTISAVSDMGAPECVQSAPIPVREETLHAPRCCTQD